jgi:large subunit ribosomal protein L16
MLQPKRSKYRKQQKGRRKGLAQRGSSVSFGDYALQSVDRGYLTSRQIEAGRMAIQRETKRLGKLFIRVFPDKPLTKKPLETRMGTGKGAVEEYVAVVLPGRVLYELEGVTRDMAEKAFKLASNKLPLTCKVLIRSEQL